MEKRTITLLEKVFKHVLDNPGILYGFYDISFDEAAFIEENQKIPLEVMETLAIDHYFEREHEEYGITYEEACWISNFLKSGSLDDRYNLLKPYFSYLVKKINRGRV